MIKTITFSDFCDEFSGERKNNFSYEGKRALFDYLEEYEESTGETVECDIIALCCEWTEYDSAIDACHDNGLEDTVADVPEDSDLIECEEANQAQALELLEQHTTVIPCKNGHVIIQNF